MDRREFFRHIVEGGTGFLVFGLAGCGTDTRPRTAPGALARLANRLEGESRKVMYDTNAMALYMGGGLGPKTGIIKVEYLLANQPVEFEFWHGHDGVNHAFTLLPEHIKELKQLKKVTLETTEVGNHTHKLFIDFSDPRWRVANAEPVEVPDDLLRR